MRIITIVMLICIGVVICSGTAAASLPGEAEAVEYLGIASAHRLADPLTRAEMATIAVRIRGLQEVARSIAGYHRFRDVSGHHWASGFIALAVDREFTHPVTDVDYKPDRPVSVDEFMDTVAAVWGYPSFTADLVQDSCLQGRQEVSRGDAFCFIAELLTIPMGPKVAGHDWVTVLERTYGADRVNGVVERVKDGRVMLNYDGEQAEFDLASFIDITSWEGLKVSCWIDSDRVIGVRVDADTEFHYGSLTFTDEGDVVVGDDEFMVCNDVIVYRDRVEIDDRDIGSFGQIAVRSNVVTHIWSFADTSSVVVHDVDDGWIIDEQGSLGMMPVGVEFRHLAGNPYRSGVIAGDLLYGVGDEGFFVQRGSRVTGMVDAIAGSDVVIDGIRFNIDATIARPGQMLVSTSSDMCLYQFVGQRIDAIYDYEGRIKHVMNSPLAEPYVGLVTETRSDAMTIVGPAGKAVYFGSISADEGDVIRFTGDEAMVCQVCKDEIYLTPGNVDPVLMRVHDHDGMQRQLAAETMLFYVDHDPISPFVEPGVTALHGSMIAHYHFSDPAGGAVARLICESDQLLTAIVAEAAVDPALFFSPVMYGVVVCVNEEAGELAVRVKDSLLVIDLDGVSVRARSGRHAGLTVGDVGSLRAGEVASIHFDDDGDMLRIVEVEAETNGGHSPDFVVAEYDRDLRSVKLRSYLARQQMELLLVPDTIIYDAATKTMVGPDDLQGRVVHVISHSDGLAKLLVVVE